MPPALVEAHFPGARVEDGAAATSVSALCRLRGGERPAEIGYTCVGDPRRALERARASARTVVRDLPDVAADAFVLSYGPSAPRVTLFVADDDTGCWLSASVGAGRDHGALARALAGALAPEASAGRQD